MLHSDDIGRIRRRSTDGSHDRHQNVLLDGEGTVVKRIAEDPHVRHHRGPKTTEREGKELGGQAGNVGGRISKEEELVKTGDDHGPYGAHEITN